MNPPAATSTLLRNDVSNDDTELDFAIRVTKRDGNLQEINQAKMYECVEARRLGLKDIDVDLIVNQTLSGLHNGITTKELYTLLIQNCAMLISEEPQYSKLGARLLNRFIHDRVQQLDILKFSDSIDYGEKVGLIAPKVAAFVRRHQEDLNDAIYEPDHFEYFGLRTVFDRYLLKDPDTRLPIETPQYFLLRVACGLARTKQEALEFYKLISSFEYMPSTPTLFNSGTNHPQMSSCYLLDSPKDDLVEIYNRYRDIAVLSKFAGGIGLSFSRVRSSGSLIEGTNGKSNGIVPFLKTLDSSVSAVNQGGKRKGAACVYLETWHADIRDFLQLRENTGDEQLRTHNLNLANWIPDIFMRRVESDGTWSLFDPAKVPEFVDLYGEAFDKAYEDAEAAGRYEDQVPARILYATMMKSLAQTGNGWMTFKDASNLKANQVGGDKANVIHLSNLCVAPETQILTKSGYQEIASLADQKVEVWNGIEWSETTVKKTAPDQKLMKVKTSDGFEIECTPYHKFYLSNGKQVAAYQLQKDDKLLKWNSPVIKEGKSIPSPYTQGVFSGDGCHYGDENHIDLYHDKMALLPHLDCVVTHKTQEKYKKKRVKVSPYFVKFEVPINACLDDKLLWLAGLSDADGTISRNGTNQSLQIASIHVDFLKQISFMLQTMGVSGKVRMMRDRQKKMMPDGHGSLAEYQCQALYRILITSVDLHRLVKLGFAPKRLSIKKHKPQRDAKHFVKIESAELTDRIADTYCFTESKRGMGVFNGILTGQCTEIIEVTNDKETAVCNLGSINLSKYVKNGDIDYEKLAKNVQTAVKYLDRVIDINFYPTDQASTSNSKWRPVGLGLMGLQDAFFKLDLPYDSPKAKKISKKVQEEIYYNALLTSVELAEVYGPHDAFEQTKASKGQLQYDLWDINPDSDRWVLLKERIKSSGLRNSLLIAIAPTATIASICGAYEAIEPQLSNLFKRETLSGEFLQINFHLVEKLKKLGLWNQAIRNKIKLADGSIQNISEIPEDIRQIYRTVWEIPQRNMIDMAADRGAFIDQSQSLNLFIENPTIGKLSSMYLYAWKKGLKTTYYLRSRSATKIKKTTIGSQLEAVDADAIACSLENPETCESCQ